MLRHSSCADGVTSLLIILWKQSCGKGGVVSLMMIVGKHSFNKIGVAAF